jgi:mono/diheme cytochrome c family protein
MAPLGKFWLHAGITLAVLLALGTSAAALVVYGGVYDVAAIHQHTAPVYAVLDLAKTRSIEVRARCIAAPSLAGSELAERGFRLYRDHCVICHGAPGVPRGDPGKGMLPLPTDLVQAGRERSPEYIYWVVENGIRMTGMPAWRFRLDAGDRWAVTAFVVGLPALSPRDYAALARKLGEAEPYGR